jgi:hypothetical protein
MTGDPTVQVWLRRDDDPIAGDGVCCVAGVTWPNGFYSEWRERSGFDPLPGEIGAAWNEAEIAQLKRDWQKASQHPKFAAQWPEFSAYEAYAHKNHRLDYVFRGAFGSMIRDTFRQSLIKQWNGDATLQQIWPSFDEFWEFSVRQPAHTHTGGPFSNLKSIKNLPGALKQAATIVAPLAANLVIPGAGVALAAASAAANVASSTKKAAETIAKAKTVGTVAKALSNPRTQQALVRAGVHPDHVKRTAALFQGIRNATAAIALQQKGQHAAAEPYKRAAAAHAAAAKLPVQQSAQKLYYLAIAAPGGP